MYADNNAINPVAPLTIPLGAANATIQIYLAGRQGCGLGLAAGTLAATLTPEISIDGTTWIASSFIDVTGTTTTTLVLTNPNAASQTGIVVVGGTQQARVRVSAYTSGTANATMVATSAWSQVPGGGGGGGGTVTQGPGGASPWLVKQTRATTPAQTSVASSITTVSLLTSNVNRLGATVYNDSTAILFLKLGATASATSYTTQMVGGAYYEVPFNYTGAIDGIWATANGNARITELT